MRIGPFDPPVVFGQSPPRREATMLSFLRTLAFQARDRRRRRVAWTCDGLPPAMHLERRALLARLVLTERLSGRAVVSDVQDQSVKPVDSGAWFTLAEAEKDTPGVHWGDVRAGALTDTKGNMTTFSLTLNGSSDALSTPVSGFANTAFYQDPQAEPTSITVRIVPEPGTKEKDGDLVEIRIVGLYSVHGGGEFVGSAQVKMTYTPWNSLTKELWHKSFTSFTTPGVDETKTATFRAKIGEIFHVCAGISLEGAAATNLTYGYANLQVVMGMSAQPVVPGQGKGNQGGSKKKRDPDEPKDKKPKTKKPKDGKHGKKNDGTPAPKKGKNQAQNGPKKPRVDGGTRTNPNQTRKRKKAKKPTAPPVIVTPPVDPPTTPTPPPPPPPPPPTLLAKAALTGRWAGSFQLEVLPGTFVSGGIDLDLSVTEDGQASGRYRFTNLFVPSIFGPQAYPDGTIVGATLTQDEAADTWTLTGTLAPDLPILDPASYQRIRVTIAGSNPNEVKGGFDFFNSPPGVERGTFTLPKTPA